MNIRKILFPVDLLGSSAKIVPQVRSMAEKFNSEVHLLFVADCLEQYSTFFVPHPSLDKLEVENMTRAEKKLNEFMVEHFSGSPRVKAVVLRGNTVEQIRNYVNSEGMDMIIVASHDRHGIERALFGSVVSEIIRVSSVPVMCFNVDIEDAKWREAARFTERARKMPAQPALRQ